VSHRVKNYLLGTFKSALHVFLVISFLLPSMWVSDDGYGVLVYGKKNSTMQVDETLHILEVERAVRIQDSENDSNDK